MSGSDGTRGLIKCWGSGGQRSGADAGGRWDKLVPVQHRHTVFASVTTGIGHTCGVRAEDNIGVCWRIDGVDGSGLPAGEDAAAVPVSQRYGAVTVDVDARSTEQAGYGVREQYYLQFKQLAAGDEHTCGILLSSSEVLCWGNDDFQQCSGAPAGVMFASISSGARNTCGITAAGDGGGGGGRLLCWGDTSISVPANLVSSSFRSVSVGTRHACALLADHDAARYGSGTRPPPVSYPSHGGNPLRIRTAGSTVVCFGDNRYGQASPPTPSLHIDWRFMEVSAGESSTCGITYTQHLVCWGQKNKALLGMQHQWERRRSDPGVNRRVQRQWVESYP